MGVTPITTIWGGHIAQGPPLIRIIRIPRAYFRFGCGLKIAIYVRRWSRRTPKWEWAPRLVNFILLHAKLEKGYWYSALTHTKSTGQLLDMQLCLAILLQRRPKSQWQRRLFYCSGGYRTTAYLVYSNGSVTLPWSWDMVLCHFCLQLGTYMQATC